MQKAVPDLDRHLAERALLYEQVQASHEQLQALSRQLLQVQEAERRAIASELHDEIGQGLTGLGLLISTSQQSPPDQVQARQAQAQALVRDLMEQVRSLALDLRPAMLDDLGLMPALVWLFERYTTQTNVSVRFEHSGLEEERRAPQTQIVALSMHANESYVLAALRNGAAAYVLKDASSTDIIQAIAARLGLSPRTVETHRTNLMRKLGLRTQTDLLRYALQRGIIPHS